MRRMHSCVRIGVLPLALSTTIASAMSSNNYTTDPVVTDNGGGLAASGNYGTRISIGKAVVGLATSASYGNELGYVVPQPGGGAPPAPPQNLTCVPGDGQMVLNWDDNTEPDLSGYSVYRSETPGGPYVQVNAAMVTVSGYTDTGLTNGTTYYYVVRAVDDGSSESADSNEASAKPLGAGVLGGGCGAGAVALFVLAVLLGRKRWQTDRH